MAVRCYRGPGNVLRATLPLLLAGALCSTIPAFGQSGPEAAARETRLRGVREEIGRLEAELVTLRGREQGVLGEIERLGKELRLREAQLDEVTLRLEQVDRKLASQNMTIEALGAAQARRRDYLSFRLREVYRAGPDDALRRLLTGAELERYLAALRYATLLNERDATVLADFRAAAVIKQGEERALAATRTELDALGRDLATRQDELRGAQRRRERLLTSIRDDQSRRKTALEELQSAAAALTQVIDSVEPVTLPTVDVRKFRGLLDWPAAGQVTEGFGHIVHPRFKTRVPHPGLDIEGTFGDDIRAVFEGRVVYAAWMRGYGLTAIVDHGGGLMSIYAHASVLLVEDGQEVLRGQSLGKIGDSGSLRGSYLYFELRLDGKATDPAEWLRSR